MSRRRLRGTVVSDKMEKTVSVAVERVLAHPLYKKRIRTVKRYLAHDDSGAGVGKEVVIEETRPLSKSKRWRVVEIEGRAVGGRGSKPAEESGKATRRVKKQ